jgi:hypothetical protein
MAFDHPQHATLCALPGDHKMIRRGWKAKHAKKQLNTGFCYRFLLFFADHRSLLPHCE